MAMTGAQNGSSSDESTPVVNRPRLYSSRARRDRTARNRSIRSVDSVDVAVEVVVDTVAAGGHRCRGDDGRDDRSRVRDHATGDERPDSREYPGERDVSGTDYLKIHAQIRQAASEPHVDSMVRSTRLPTPMNATT